MLTLHGVRKTFYDPGRGPVPAVDGITASAHGGVVAVVGANGAGKSTLLRLIATLLVPDEGRITVAGLDVTKDPEGVRRHLGYLSTTTRLYPRLTGRELLRHIGGCYGLEGAALTEALDRQVVNFALAGFLDQRLEGCSTGQLQRINLARTLIADPPVLILDEPTTGLDLVASAQVVDAVRAARKTERLILLCTHHLTEVEACADRLWLLRDGKLAWDGAPADLGTGAGLDAAVRAHLGLNSP